MTRLTTATVAGLLTLTVIGHMMVNIFNTTVDLKQKRTESVNCPHSSQAMRLSKVNASSDAKQLQNADKQLLVSQNLQQVYEKSQQSVPLETAGHPGLQPFDNSRPPKFNVGGVKSAPLLAVGIPTVLRHKQSYLIDTLKSLLTPLTPAQRENSAFVVYAAEKDENVFRQVASEVEQHFGQELRGGLLKVISPPEELFPDWRSKVHVNFGDTFERSMWRSKQNLDAQFLMSYVIDDVTPDYFLLMEDDVLASKNYMTEILSAIQSPDANKGWVYQSFTSVGGAGKAFHAKSAREFESFLRIYWNFKPLDWILWDYARNKVCGYEESSHECREKWRKVAVENPLNLFTHLGKVSSKTNRLFTPVEKATKIQINLGNLTNNLIT